MNRKMAKRPVPLLFMGALGIGIAVSLLFLGGWRSDGNRAAASDESDADSTGETYSISSVEVEYPYTTPVGADATRASVSFSETWSGDRYPGVAQCVMVLRDASGKEVVEWPFEAAYASPNSTLTGVPVEVPEGSDPVTGSAVCEAGSYPDGPGYTFEEVRVSDVEDVVGKAGWAQISVTAKWATTSEPSWRSCTMTVTTATGEDIRLDFTLSVPDGTIVKKEIPTTTHSVEDVAVTCSELK